ncbi:MAG: M14 family zinc carboxypeptidase [Phycisphaerales bacterium JB054]
MRWNKALLACLTVTLAAGWTSAQPQPQGDLPGEGYYAERYEGDKAIRVEARTARRLQTVLGLSRTVLSERVGFGRGPIEVVMSEDNLAALEGLGFDVEILIDDVQAAIDAEREEIERLRAQRDIQWYETYHPLDEMYDYIDDLVTANPTLASQEVLGQSVQGRDIIGLRITAPGDPSGRVQVAINGCQHAREWVSPTTVLFVVEQLLNGYGNDQQITDLMDRIEFVVVPMVNPDGYEYTWTTYRLWRKNRRNNGNGTTGVDLNRNWGYQWGGSGSSGNSSSDIYRGPSPFSEPETTIVSDHFLGLPRAAAHIDFHSFSQLILYPWGYTFNQLPEPTRTTFANLADDMSSAIEGVHGAYYRPQPASDLYIADGIASDWSYSEGMWGFTIELRPDENSGFQFELPPAQIIPTGEENLEALITLAEFVAYPIRFAFPDGEPAILEAGVATELAVTVSASTGTIDSGSVALFSRIGSSGQFTETPMVFVGQDTYTGDLPAASCGDTVEWYVGASTTEGADATYPRAGAAGPASAEVLDLTFAMLDDAESDNGWTVGASGDDATTGIWGRMNPEGTDAQPEDDHTPAPGTDCWVTDGRAGSSIGAYDVDGGTTTLTSPSMDATGGLDEPIAVLSYWRWYSNDQGSSANEDSMPVEVSFDGGSSWTLLEDVSENANAWVYREFVLNDIAEPTANVRVRFRARDLGSGSIVEAGVDDVGISVYGCQYRPGDYNRDGDVNTLDVLAFLNDWAAGDPMADWNHDGEVNTLDVLAFLNDWNMG